MFSSRISFGRCLEVVAVRLSDNAVKEIVSNEHLYIGQLLIMSYWLVPLDACS